MRPARSVSSFEKGSEGMTQATSEPAPERKTKGGVVTNAASSGVRIERKTTQDAHCAGSDRPGLLFIACWAGGDGAGRISRLVNLGNALRVVGNVPVWSHSVSPVLFAEPRNRTRDRAFRTRWLNETVFWLTSLLYGEEPLHRRYTHTNHHTHTWHVGFG